MKDEVLRAISKLKKSIYEPQEQGDSPHKTVINVGRVFDKIDKWGEELQEQLDNVEVVNIKKTEKIVIENQSVIINALAKITCDIGCVLNRSESTLLADKLINQQFIIEDFLKTMNN